MVILAGWTRIKVEPAEIHYKSGQLEELRRRTRIRHASVAPHSDASRGSFSVSDPMSAIPNYCLLSGLRGKQIGGSRGQRANGSERLHETNSLRRTTGASDYLYRRAKLLELHT